MNILYLHSKTIPSNLLAKRVTQLAHDAKKYFNTLVAVRAARSDFEQNFTGNWDEWAEGLVFRKNTMTRRFVYDALITDLVVFGRATTIALRTGLMALEQKERKSFCQPIKVMYWKPPEKDGEEGAFKVLTAQDLIIVDEQDYVCTAMLRQEEEDESNAQ